MGTPGLAARGLALGILALLTPLATLAGEEPAGSKAAAAEAATRPTEGWRHHCPEVDAKQEALIAMWETTRALVLGEVHGSAEVPFFTHEAVCAGLQAGTPLVLGLEIFSGEQARIDAYLQSSGDAGARAALLAGPFWTRSYQDGRSSVAMLELIESTRRLVAAGAPLTLHCFDNPKRPGAADRDHAMALAVLTHDAKVPGRRHVLLMGNLHANVEIGTPFNPKLKPTAWYLDQTMDRVLAMKARHGSGEFWVCNPECGVSQSGGRGKPEKRGEILLFPKRGAGWDGIFDIGTPTASPPATQNDHTQ